MHPYHPLLHSHHAFLGLAMLLVAVWVFFRLALAITSGLLHLLWIGAIVCGALWLFAHLGHP